MVIYREIKGHNNYIKHWYRSDDSFTYEYAEYERDEHNGRCYRLEPSNNLRDPNMDGALVRHRISLKLYKELLEKAKEACLVRGRNL